jgi:hypothetical protein
VCSECKHAVLPSHVDAHLKDEEKHRAVKADRERVVRAIQAIWGLKTKTAELNHLVFPPASNPPHSHITTAPERRVKMSIARRLRQPMPVYCMSSPKNPGALSSGTPMGEPAKERPARDRERRASSMEKRGPLPAFFRPWARSTIFRGASSRIQSSYAIRRRQFGCRQDGVKASHATSRRGSTPPNHRTGGSPRAQSMVAARGVG